MANKLVSNLILFPFLFFNVEFNNNWKFILNKETESGFLLNINTNTKTQQKWNKRTHAFFYCHFTPSLLAFGKKISVETK